MEKRGPQQGKGRRPQRLRAWNAQIRLEFYPGGNRELLTILCRGATQSTLYFMELMIT